MNYDITFCNKKDCSNRECERNQRNIPEIEYKIREIWQGNFEECEYWVEKDNE